MLLDLAHRSIVAGLSGRPSHLAPLDDLPDALRAERAAFVTLTVDGALNGCIGSIEAVEGLAAGVVRLARAAAFEDPRLPPLRPEQLDRTSIEISVLSALERIAAGSRAELLAGLRPGIDGLLIGAGRRRGVFLPAVWEQLPDPEAFLDHLQVKAGMVPGPLVAGLVAHRFTVDKVRRDPEAATDAISASRSA